MYVNYKPDEFVYLLDVMNFVYDKLIANQSTSNVLQKVIITVYYVHLFCLIESGWVGTLEIIETFFSS